MKNKMLGNIAASIVILALCCSAQLSAQVPSDLGAWNHITLIKSFGKPYAMARLEHRSYDNMGSTECAFAMAGGGYRFTKWLQGDLSYEYWKIPAAGDTKYHKAVFCLTGTLRREALSVSLKEKYELAFNAAGGSPSGTLRTRLRTQYSPSDFILRPYLISEFFNGFNGTGWIRSLHYIGTDIPVGQHSTFDLYYMYHLYNRAGSVASCHILGLGYTFVF